MYFVVGPSEPIVAELQAVKPTDCFYQAVATFGIDESRSLREQQAKRVAAGQERFFIIVSDFLTIEAQNALLKMLEEPGYGNRFFFILPVAGFLLPTLVSRGEVLYYNPGEPLTSPLAAQFVAGNLTARLAVVKRTLAAAEKIDSSAARQQALELVLGLSRYYRQTITSQNPVTPEWRLCGRELVAAQSNLQKTGTVPKLILEHLALIWPLTGEMVK